jgi:hypothetical protein
MSFSPRIMNGRRGAHESSIMRVTSISATLSRISVVLLSLIITPLAYAETIKVGVFKIAAGSCLYCCGKGVL